jgi:hypothetical protein
MEKIAEKLLLGLILGGLIVATFLVTFAPHLPFTLQRRLAFLPLNISQAARMDAEASREWRLEMRGAIAVTNADTKRLSR